MCRMDESKSSKGNYTQNGTSRGKIGYNGVKLELFDEWIGCINYCTTEVIDKVGGYDLKELPQHWGYHDCEWGRRLKKAGFISFVPYYPSLDGLTVIEDHDSSYDEMYQSTKYKYINEYGYQFRLMESRIVSGEKPVFFDYRINQ